MAIIELDNVSLSYPVYGSNAKSFKVTLLNLTIGGRLENSNGTVSVEALSNISFKLNKGDRLALIGRNGAGKSTLLKVLAQIYQPTEGKISVKGRSQCIFDIMMGMDNELTGVENILLRGLILGLSKPEARALILKVEEFAELGSFITMPIKTYSSGMKMRLAFGIITCVKSEILLIDEIVNVGDAEFLEKAKRQMEKLVHECDVMVLSTHDTNIVKEFCNKVIWLEQGNIKNYGEVDEVLSSYLKL